MRRSALGKKPRLVTDTPRWHCRGPRSSIRYSPLLPPLYECALYNCGGRGLGRALAYNELEYGYEDSILL
jgi:hypothetical protein